MTNLSDIRRGSDTLVRVCAWLQSNETALVVSDHSTVRIGRSIFEAVKEVTRNASHLVIEPFAMHGQEPPSHIAQQMSSFSVVFGVTKMSMAHTKARQMASLKGVRYLSLPDYSFELLSSQSLRTDFKKLTPLVLKITELLSNAKEVFIKTRNGTELSLRIDGRQANSSPGWCDGLGTFVSPPDVESNIAPLEAESNGVIAVDGSIPYKDFGLLDSPIMLEVKNGRIVKISGKYSTALEKVLDSPSDITTRILAELGFGLNPNAKLSGFMLEDEGSWGTVHLGFGSNSTIGGANHIAFHLDMVLLEPTVFVDGVIILNEYKFFI
jgi:2,5-dihydroxypyridine 5,6-dioxygenase